MSARGTITTGDNVRLAIDLTTKGKIFPVQSGSTVQAVFIDGPPNDEGTKMVGTPVTTLEADIGADWPNGVITPLFPSADTILYPTIDSGFIEIQVTIAGVDTTFLAPVRVVKGYI